MAKILIAEDDQITRRVISNIIEKMGHVVIQASNGKVALSILLDNPDIEMLVTDVMMPDMGGEALINILRGKPEFDVFPIIIISGVVGPRAIANLLDNGASVFVAKPVKSDDLRNYVKYYLKGAAAHP